VEESGGTSGRNRLYSDYQNWNSKIVIWITAKAGLKLHRTKSMVEINSFLLAIKQVKPFNKVSN
jgi:hypothetical protein